MIKYQGYYFGTCVGGKVRGAKGNENNWLKNSDSVNNHGASRSKI